MPRATARHGLKASKTSPSRSVANGIPTQKTTNTTVGTRFAVALWVPAKPAHTVTTKAATPTAPHRTSSAAGARHTRRSTARSRRGRGHSVANATNETTSTTAAAQANSQRGIGRSCLPTSP